MFSATWPDSVISISNEFLNNPVQIRIGQVGGVARANSSVHQIVEVIDERVRDVRLVELLRKYHKKKSVRIIVFVLYKMEATRVEKNLRYKGFNVGAIHGNLAQNERIRALNQFRDGEIPILVATDVAARGLDIPDVEYVINYSFPLTIEDYVHRIGRTGRAGKTGEAYTMFTKQNKSHGGALANILRQCNMKVPDELTAMGNYVKKKTHSMYGDHFKSEPVAGKSKHTRF